MFNSLLKTCTVMTGRHARMVLYCSLWHVIIKPTVSLRHNTARVLINQTIPRGFHLNVRQNDDDKKTPGEESSNSSDSSSSSDDSDAKESQANASAADPILKDLSEEEMDKYFPDHETKKQYKLLLLEVEILRQNGEDVPSILKLSQVKKLLKAPSKTFKCKFLRYLFINEKKKMNEPIKKEMKKQQYEQQLKSLNSDGTSGLQYGLGRNCMFLRIYNQTMHNAEALRLIQALQFEPTLLVDCSYEEHMNTIEVDNCVRQIVFGYSQNRQNPQPFNLQLCNINPNGYFSKKLQKTIPQILDKDFPMVVDSRSYVDMYDKQDLVYLTPHCKNTLVTYDPHKIYIIGAIVDKAHSKHLSSTKAKKEGITMMRLPLDEYVQWAPGSGKCLAVNIMLSIMLTVKNTRNWEEALKHIPRRKLMQHRLHRVGQQQLG